MKYINIVTADINGNAPSGCKPGTLVKTLCGTYVIVSRWRAFWFRRARYNAESGYWSEQVLVNKWR